MSPTAAISLTAPMSAPLPPLDADACWSAVLTHDADAARAFVYAVTSTGVYCRATCRSRRPRRAHVRFFPTPERAELAGFRACRRCHPRGDAPPDAAVAMVRRACAVLDRRLGGGPITLAALAREIGATPGHVQRAFARLLGISPHEYASARRAERFRDDLRGGKAVSAAVYDAGYGSISRVYEQRPTGPGVTPAQYRRGAPGMTVWYSVVESPLGTLLLGATDSGLCTVKLGDAAATLERELRDEFPRAQIVRDDERLREWATAIVDHVSGARRTIDLPIDLQGTAFQWRVWRALQKIPYGQTRTYGEVANAIGSPAAVRAVGRACATNPVALVIPCHRVLPKQGGTGGYRWGVTRKEKLLALERTKDRRAEAG